jgi:hypothetical protein
MTAADLLARLVQSGDTGGFSETADFAETCSVYLAGTVRHQLVVGAGMLSAFQDTELAVRGYPYGGGGSGATGDPATTRFADRFRSGVVSRCTDQPGSLVREAASIEYVAHRDIYKPI